MSAKPRRAMLSWRRCGSSLDNPRAATDALAPILDGSILMLPPHDWLMQALLLETVARNALGDPAAAGHALARALDLAEPEGILIPFLLHPVDPLLRRHARETTAHAALIQAILTAPVPTAPTDPGGRSAPSGGHGTAGRSPMIVEGLVGIVPPGPTQIRPPMPAPPESLSASEVRVLRFLPTNLSAPEIAAELSVSVNTVRTHMRHVYAKLGAHHRTGAVERARACGLLTRSAPTTNRDHRATAG